MRVVLTYTAPNGQSQQMALRKGESVTIGGSPQAGWTIRDRGLESVHVEFKVSSDATMLLTNLHPADEAVLVGGKAVADSLEVSDGEKFRCGDAAIEVRAEGVAKPKTDEPTQPLLKFREDMIKERIYGFHGTKRGEARELLLQELSQHGNLAILADFPAADVSAPESASEDLLTEFPAGELDGASLQLVAANQSDDQGFKILANCHEGFTGSLGSIVVVYQIPSDEVFSKLNKYIGWFVKPRSLSVALENSSESFIRGLFGDINAVFIDHGSGFDWQIFVKVETTDIIQGIRKLAAGEREESSSDAPQRMTD